MTDTTPPRRRRRTPAPAPVTIVRPVNDATLAAALDRAGGDRRRLSANPDGSVTILNAPRQPRTTPWS